MGAGSVWHVDGLIVTNAHVARGNSIRVTLPDGRQMHGRVLAREPDLDLAAIGVEATGLSAAELGDSRGMRPGEMVMSMGHPWSVEGDATAGVVIGVGEATREASMAGREWIVASLRLRPGHSGGPMVDAQGRLIGINTMITGPEVAMDVPVHVAKEFLVGALQLVQQRTAA
ncbi:MAG: serine protease [SAR202 cluster bacterium]|nr:serine protease [SAR202 cluster bacterium]